MWQRAVNKFIRIVFKLKSHDSVTTITRQNKILTINQQTMEHDTARLMHNYLHDTLPTTYKNLLKIIFVQSFTNKKKFLSFSSILQNKHY